MLLVTTAGAAGLLVGGVTAADAATTVTAQAGDTVTTIAARYDTTVTAFEQANNINTATHMIYAGQTYTLPGSASTQTTTTTSAQPAAQSTQTYTYTQPTQTTNYQSSNNSSSNNSQTSSASTQATSAASTSTSSSYTSSASGSEAAAKAWIANKESGGSYTATNGQYIGKYQLTASYLNGDYSASNQEKVADAYVASRYGSWTAAKAYWEANGSY